MTNAQHRVVNTVMIIVTICVVVLYAVKNEHDMEECEARLYEKLTSQSAPDLKAAHK